MKTLIISNMNSIWTMEYIKNILLRVDTDIYAVAFEPIKEEYKKQYLTYKIHIIDLSSKKTWNNKIFKALKLCYIIKKNCKKNKFDYVDIQGVPSSFQAYILACIVKRYANTCICTFLGSDLFRVDSNKKTKKLLNAASYIVLGTKDMQAVFWDKYGVQYNNKIVDCKFGTPSFEEIKLLKSISNKEQCKAFWKFPQNKIVVAIGYNASTAQQHIAILEQINKIDKEKKEKIHLVVQFGYGNDDSTYRDIIENLLLAGGYSYSFIDKMLIKNEIAKLRIATDVFIHGQTTDALSGSIREIIYAENILINPKWIVYSDFQELGIEYIEYSYFSELSEILSRILENKISVNSKNNAELAYDRYSWESVKKQWMEIYDKR